MAHGHDVRDSAQREVRDAVEVTALLDARRDLVDEHCCVCCDCFWRGALVDLYLASSDFDGGRDDQVDHVEHDRGDARAGLKRRERDGVGNALLDAREGLLGLGEGDCCAGRLHDGVVDLRAHSGNDLGDGRDGRDLGGVGNLTIAVAPIRSTRDAGDCVSAEAVMVMSSHE